MGPVADINDSVRERRHLSLAPQPKIEAEHRVSRGAMTWHERLADRERRRSHHGMQPPWPPPAAA
jgi:hypothetical protein